MILHYLAQALIGRGDRLIQPAHHRQRQGLQRALARSFGAGGERGGSFSISAKMVFGSGVGCCLRVLSSHWNFSGSMPFLFLYFKELTAYPGAHGSPYCTSRPPSLRLRVLSREALCNFSRSTPLRHDLRRSWRNRRLCRFEQLNFGQ